MSDRSLNTIGKPAMEGGHKPALATSPNTRDKPASQGAGEEKGKRTCKKCQATKPESDFYRTRTWCKRCISEQRKDQRVRDKAILQAATHSGPEKAGGSVCLSATEMGDLKTIRRLLESQSEVLQRHTKFLNAVYRKMQGLEQKLLHEPEDDAEEEGWLPRLLGEVTQVKRKVEGLPMLLYAAPL